MDYDTTVVPGRQTTTISSATTTTVVSSPSSGTRNVKSLIISNDDTTSVVVTILHHDGTNSKNLYKEISIGPSGTITYFAESGFNLSDTGLSVVDSWQGQLHWTYGRSDPQQGMRMAQMSGTIAATPTNITNTIARISYFRPPKNIIVNTIRFYGVGNVTGIYQTAIYNGDTLERLTGQMSITTTASTWGKVGDDLALTLSKDQLYFMAVSASTTSTTAGMLCCGPSLAATTGQIVVLPKAWPGSINIDNGFMDGGYAQFAVSAGALTNPAATIAAQAAWVGGFPLLLLDNNNA